MQRRRSRYWRAMAIVVVSGAVTATSMGAPAAAPGEMADLVITNAKIYTVDPARSVVQSVAVRNGKVTFVGSDADVRRFIGPLTHVDDLGGHLVLPGLFDSHLHPLAMIKVEGCDLESKQRSLRELSAFVAECVKRYPARSDGWLNVHQWNFADGNQPDPEFPTLRAALDHSSGRIAIQLIGNDGHHGAFNSLALARAKNSQGVIVGLSKATLGRDFLAYSKVVGVDAYGNPNGAVNESAKALMGPPSILFADFDAAIEARAELPALLNSRGITGILDALVPAKSLLLYDSLERDHLLTFRATLAQFFVPEEFEAADGNINYAGMLALAKQIRGKYADNPLISANFVKLHADGVMEGNPYAVPPTLPNSLSLRAYLQPIFGRDRNGKLTVTGYVDTTSALCRETRAHTKNYDDPAEVRKFTAVHGFHPGQCAISRGQLRHHRKILMEFVRRFHEAGFTLHIHAIDDGSVSVALDALEAARAVDGIATQHDGLAHVQLAQPSDVLRIGRDHLYVAFTYSWANADPDYDMTVVPFIDKVIGNDYPSLHSPNNYYERNVYPFKAVKAAGGVLVGGSDAPVETRDPQPFVNMAAAVTRRLPGQPPQNPAQAISIRDVIDAYTINGARFLNRDAEAGSIEVGKSADFVELNQDILELADGGHAGDVARTQVLKTWFQGRAVYVAAH